MSRKPWYALALVGCIVLVAGALSLRGALAQAPEASISERAEGADTSVRIHHVTLDELPGVQAAGVTPLYHVAGVLNIAGDQGTAVICTNLDAAASVTIEVQLYNFSAAFVDTGAISISPLRTATFESTPIAFYLADVSMSAGDVEQGYARILTSHSSVICTAQVMVTAGSPPAWSMDLPVYRQGYGVFLPAVLKAATP